MAQPGTNPELLFTVRFWRHLDRGAELREKGVANVLEGAVLQEEWDKGHILTTSLEQNALSTDFGWQLGRDTSDFETYL